MIIDVHAHIFEQMKEKRLQNPLFPHIDTPSVEKYIEAMDKAGVDIGISVGHGNGNMDFSDFEYQAKIQEKYPDRIVALASIHPRLDGAPETFKRCVEDLGLKGIKLHGYWDQFAYSDHGLLDPIMETCNKYKLPAVIHVAGDHCPSGPLQFEELAKTWPDVTFFMSHGGGFWATGEAMMVAKRNKNVIIDTSCCEHSWITYFTDELGADKVAMGSDWPYMYLDVTVEIQKMCVPSKDDLKMVMGETARKAFRL